MPAMGGRKTKQRRKKAGGSEWVGGRLVTPFYVTEGEPYRPEMNLWLEWPDDLVVGNTLIDPKNPPVSLGETLQDAMESPLIGPPRRPSRVRVADKRLAAEVREAVGDIEVVVAPTPELNRILRAMAESMPGDGGDEGPSYFEGGRVPAEAVESLFGAAELIFRVAPWEAADDGQVLRMDIPGLGVEGACVSIIGALGESLGIIIFPSLVAFDRFLDAVDSRDLSEGPIDLGTETLSLNFERGADLPPAMLREAMENGWRVAGPDAYPWVQHRERDGVLRPLTERDVRVVSACARSLMAFFVKHRDLFGRESFEPVCESYLDENDLEVRFTVPYEASGLFEANDPPAPREPEQKPVKVGRNAPCPCGSGKKYKKCCLGKDEVAKAAERAPAAVHEIDERLVGQIMRFAARRFGEAWFRAAEDFDKHEEAVQLYGPWAVYHYTVEGKPAVQWFVEERGRRLSDTELEWIRAQRAAWLSVWEVQEVEFGSRIVFLDLLTGEERTVVEVSGSKTLARRDVVLGRIVDHRGVSVLCGVHPRPLPPVEAAEVVRRIRGRLRRKRAVPVDRLRDEKIGRYIIARWDEAVLDLDIRRSVPPRLQNTDGEELVLTVDHFEFDRADRGKIEKRLAALEGVVPPEPGEADRGYSFTRPGNPMHKAWDNTVVGRAEVLDGKLRLETNSVQRADAFRERVEAALGGLVSHRAREHLDPFTRKGDRPEHRQPDPEAPEIPAEAANELILEYKEKHYTGWADHPLPGLDGKTPREAVRTKAGRKQVDLLLKDCENREARMPKGQRYDFSRLRRELGLEA